MGFDHIALCMGAGKPTVLDMPNGLARGVRQASDFLMALQLTGAAKTSSHRQSAGAAAGGGDRRRADRDRYRDREPRLLPRAGGEIPRALRDAGGRARRGRGARGLERRGSARSPTNSSPMPRAIRAERAAAAREGRAPRAGELLDGWGGATIAYRRRLIDAPSYTLNHEEVAKAMEEGVRFAEGLTPHAVEVDRFGHAAATARHARRRRESVSLPARTILVAAGTQPNTVLAREDRRMSCSTAGISRRSTKTGNPVTPERGWPSRTSTQVLMHRAGDGRFISFFGDLHPCFFGNVVKAMGGAKRGYPVVSAACWPAQPAVGGAGAGADRALLATSCAPRCTRCIRLTPDHRRGGGARAGGGARLPARPVLPAAEFRDPARRASRRHDALAMEGLAMTGAWTDPDARPGLDDRAGDGRLVRPLRAAEAGRAGGPDGPDRHADRNPRRRDRGCWSAAGWATRCCSRSARRCARRARR